MGFIEQLQSVVKEISTKVIEVAPAAAGLMLDALQLRAILEITTSSVSLLIFVYLAHFLLKGLDFDDDAKFDRNMTRIVAFIPITLIAAHVGFFRVLNPERLIMAFSPEAGLALQAFDAIVK
jgi:tellurite resistance protein TehA-like permease